MTPAEGKLGAGKVFIGRSLILTLAFTRFRQAA